MFDQTNNSPVDDSNCTMMVLPSLSGEIVEKRTTPNTNIDNTSMTSTQEEVIFGNDNYLYAVKSSAEQNALFYFAHISTMHCPNSNIFGSSDSLTLRIG